MITQFPKFDFMGLHCTQDNTNIFNAMLAHFKSHECLYVIRSARKSLYTHSFNFYVTFDFTTTKFYKHQQKSKFPISCFST